VKTITSFTVPGVNRGDDAEIIRGAVGPAAGVSEVVINLPARLVQVEYDEDRTSPHALKTVIESAGYLVQRYSDGKRL
jgi:copper chaperone CopZ